MAWAAWATQARSFRETAARPARLQSESCERLLRPRNDKRRPFLHSKSAAIHSEQHAGDSLSQPAWQLIVDEVPFFGT